MNKQIVFCGFGALAYDSLKMLLEKGYDINCVLTHKDDSVEGVDTLCREELIQLHYNNPQKNIDFYKELFSHHNKAILLSVNYRFILPKDIIKCFNVGFNLHGSLLPKYRGRTPHVWAIINGENKTGVTSHMIVEKVDAGDIIIQKVVNIDDNETGDDIIKKYRKIYPQVILESFDKIKSGDSLLKQNEKEATYFGKRIPEMGYVDPYQSTKRIQNFIRAIAPPYPGAYFFDKTGEKIIIGNVSIQNYKNEEVLSIGVLEEIEGSFYLNCLENKLKIEKYFWEKR